ncbi:solute:sodium symporter family transporter [Alkalicoccobacillus porphyridii]|uniref:Solute:sodium symporter family transporter n=1 Tax=Alkalicoccobacillus porphyridii TaxID=2597270 RepID=A0A554A0Y1_9BACI|nr:solute:sodium symporter family transporter [Alkalicoccobacillus porphyridii]TSB47350.1 solute:sodium symporter family transporter [Alkalicoccobacillus porphyridii]
MGIFSVVTFVVLVAAIWLFAYKRSRGVDLTSSEGLFLGGRSLTGITISGSVVMTNLSTEQIVGQNGQSYETGMEVMGWEVTAAIAIVALALIFLPKYLKHGVDTVTDFIEIRFDTATKRIASLLFIFTYVISFLPVVLYSGALVFNQIFSIEGILNVSSLVAISLISGVIGVIGLLYLLIGGLRLSAFSDTVYGFGLLVAGLSIPILGLIVLGDGSFLGGFETIREQTPEKLNSFGAVDSLMVPWPTLFLGLFFNNLFFWCTNQLIVQKVLAGRDLKEGQKGALYVGFFKIFGALFLVFPGIVAYNFFGDSVEPADNAYPMLVTEILPEWMLGFFAAVIFGAILSSFVGALNATTTLMTLDFYKPLKKNATDAQVARAGKMFTIIVGLISTIIAPLISFAPAGLFHIVQQFNGLYSMPLLAVIILGFYSKYATPFAAKVTFIFHLIVYSSTQLFTDIHYLYVFSVIFFVDLLLLWAISRFQPSAKTFTFPKAEVKVDLTPWKHAKWLSAVIVIIVLLTYWVFSPWGIAA